jgi:predicted phage terminase large subunit-like protein
VSVPPRHGKSYLCSLAFPAWFVGVFPDKRVMLGSYEASFAAGWGRGARDMLSSWGPRLFGVQVSQDSAAGSSWTVAGKRGGMDTAGTGGPFTGKGGDLIVIDDPIKNAQEAFSPVYRDACWKWFESTVMTRLEPGGSVVVVMQRWHQDDLIGRALREMPDLGWEEVRFPAIAEEEDALGRRPGEALFPRRYDLDALEQIRRSKSSYWWNAQYQQRPSPPEGSIFLRDNWRYYDLLPERTEIVFQSWDMAFKAGTESNPVAGHLWVKSGPDYYLVDRVNRRMGFTDSLEAVRAMRRNHPGTRAVLVEDAANGPAIIEVLRKEISGVIAVRPQGGKVSRANAAEPVQRSGNVHLPNPSRCPWVKDFVEQLACFPSGLEDDDVDAFTQAINWSESRRMPGAFTVGGKG